MPFFYWQSFELSGFNFILSEHTPPYKYLLLFIPVLSTIHLFGGVAEEHFLSGRRQLLVSIPLLSLSAVFILILLSGNADKNFFDQGNVFTNTGVGFWLALMASGILVLPGFKAQLQRT